MIEGIKAHDGGRGLCVRTAISQNLELYSRELDDFLKFILSSGTPEIAKKQECFAGLYKAMVYDNTTILPAHLERNLRQYFIDSGFEVDEETLVWSWANTADTKKFGEELLSVFFVYDGGTFSPMTTEEKNWQTLEMELRSLIPLDEEDLLSCSIM